MKALLEFAKEQPFIALLITGAVVTGAVEIVAIVVLHHPINFSSLN